MVDRAAWRLKARRAWTRLRGGELTPWRAALSVAIGLAIGVTPLWGLHLPLVLAVCLPLRLDAPVAYLAANISLPMIAPLLAVAEIEIGEFVRTGHAVSLHVRDLHARGLRAFAGDLVVGTSLFAPAMALAGGALAYVGARIARVGQRGAFDEAVRRVAQRYAAGRGAAYHYVRIKLARDPVAGAVAALGAAAGLGEVVDVGCGRGQLALLLLELGAATRVTGLDWDQEKVEDARAAAGGLPVQFEAKDVRSAPLAPCDSAMLVDVLHYLADDEQDALLSRAARAARQTVVVRELDPDRGWRSALTRLQEGITTRLGMNRGARVRPRPIPALAAVLEAEGYRVRVEPCWKGTPLANVLLVASREG